MNTTQRLPVLMYHRVGPAQNDWERRYCISPGLFARHMQQLATHGMHACRLDDLLCWLAGDIELPVGSFLITFDDGFLGVYEHAVPVLRALGWTATTFLVSQLIGKCDEWCRTHNPSGATYPLMTQEQITAMQGMDFTFHSHTRLHPDLTTLSDDELATELKLSRVELEELLGKKVGCLAYPYGRYDERVLDAAKAAGYRVAFSTQPGFNRRDIDHYRIRRLEVFGTDTPAMLARKVFFGCNDGSLRQSLRYYSGRIRHRLGI